MPSVLLVEDADLIDAVLRVGLPGVIDVPAARPTTAPASMARGAAASGPAVDLEELATELRSEAAGEADPLARWSDLGNRRSLIDRVLVARLSHANAPAVDYLIASFRRCAVHLAKKAASADAMRELLRYTEGLCVSYAGIALLNPSMFPQPAAVEQEGPLRLLRFLRAEGDDPSLPEFIKQLTARMQDEGTLEELATPLFDALAADAAALSVLNPFSGPYYALLALLREKPLGALFAASPRFVPEGAPSGAVLESGSALGPFFALSAFPFADRRVPAECFSTSTAQAVEQSFASLRPALRIVQRALGSVATTLLKNPAAKEPFFRWVAALCDGNAARTQYFFHHAEITRLLHALSPERTEQPPARVASHDGLLVNLGAVLLQLCEPLMAPNSAHVAKIDASYIFSRHRIAYAEDETRLCATGDDVAYWLDPTGDPARADRYHARLAEAVAARRESAGSSADVGSPPRAAADETPLAVSASFGTISEYFFLTMRVLHMGLLTSFQLHSKMARELAETEHKLAAYQQQLDAASMGGQSAALAMIGAEVDFMRSVSDELRRAVLCYQVQLADPELLAACTRFYRLVARWLVAAARPPPEGLPLPAEVPRLFASMPEHFMEDVASYLNHLGQVAPAVFDNMAVEELGDFLTMMVTFVASPAYVKNPYLRASFTRILRRLVPRADDDDAPGRPPPSDRLALVFSAHPLAKQHLAPALMNFFVEIEFAEGYYEKYTYRRDMAEILDYFWKQPDYKAAMVDYARHTGKFVRFVNMLINDSIFTMDEALTKLGSIKTVQARIDGGNENPRVQQQLMAELQQDEQHARYFMNFTNDVMHMLEYLSAHDEVGPPTSAYSEATPNRL